MVSDKTQTSQHLSLVEAGILNGAVRFVERLKGVTHVSVPQPGLFCIRNAEQCSHLLFYHVCNKELTSSQKKEKYSEVYSSLTAVYNN